MNAIGAFVGIFVVVFLIVAGWAIVEKAFTEPRAGMPTVIAGVAIVILVVAVVLGRGCAGSTHNDDDPAEIGHGHL